MVMVGSICSERGGSGYRVYLRPAASLKDPISIHYSPVTSPLCTVQLMIKKRKSCRSCAYISPHRPDVAPSTPINFAAGASSTWQDWALLEAVMQPPSNYKMRPWQTGKGKGNPDCVYPDLSGVLGGRQPTALHQIIPK